MNFLEDDIEILNLKNKDQKSPIYYARTPKMMMMLSSLSEVDIYGRGDDVVGGETILESLLKTNPECAKTLLSSRITTNNKPLNDKELLFIYNLKLMTKDHHSTKVSSRIISV